MDITLPFSNHWDSLTSVYTTSISSVHIPFTFSVHLPSNVYVHIPSSSTVHIPPTSSFHIPSATSVHVYTPHLFSLHTLFLITCHTPTRQHNLTDTGHPPLITIVQQYLTLGVTLGLLSCINLWFVPSKRIWIRGTKKHFRIFTYNGASIVCLNNLMQIFVALLLEMPAQTWTFNACLATGVNGTSLPTFTRIVWQWFLSCTDDSSVQMMLSKLSWFFRHIFANSTLFCLFGSGIMGLHPVFTKPTAGMHAGVYTLQLDSFDNFEFLGYQLLEFG